MFKALYTLLVLVMFLPLSWAQTDAIQSESELQSNTAEGYAGDMVYSSVEQMPRFPGCEHLDINDKQQCAQNELLMFIYKNLKYPAYARENSIQGTTLIRYTIEKDGSITNISIVKPLAPSLDAESLRVINQMAEQEQWIPGIQDGQPVRVEFTLPIKFKLEGNSNKQKKKHRRY